MNSLNLTFPREQKEWESVFSPIRINESSSSFVANFGSFIEEDEYFQDMSTIIDRVSASLAKEVMDEYLDEAKGRDTKRCAKTAVSGNRISSAIGVVRQPNKKKRSAFDKVPTITNVKTKVKVDNRSRSKLSQLKLVAGTKPPQFDQ